ncbi:hypothetical protein HanRHA438_Chr13g0580541 [Helianthus annuus]|nr:hypothetical protein HanRHA438_Chr13g0580541 [Helianthus annuus]
MFLIFLWFLCASWLASVDGCFCWVTDFASGAQWCPVVPAWCRWCPVVPIDLFIGSDDDGVARMVEGRFLNLQPDFYNNDYWKL